MKRILHDELPEDNYYVLKYVVHFLTEVSNTITKPTPSGVLSGYTLVTRALYHTMIYQLYRYFGFTIHIVSFILVVRYFKQYIFA